MQVLPSCFLTVLITFWLTTLAYLFSSFWPLHEPFLSFQATRGAVTASCIASLARSCTFVISTLTTTATWRARTRRSWPGLRWPGWTASSASQRPPPYSSSLSPCWSPWWRLWWWRKGPGRGTVERTGKLSHRRKLRALRLERLYNKPARAGGWQYGLWDWRVNSQLPVATNRPAACSTRWLPQKDNC